MKKIKKLSQAKLLKKYEAQMREIILDRDGDVCAIAEIEHVCSKALCADHRPAKRGNHSTFFDPRNLTTVCTVANWLAERNPFISDAILQVVRRRECPGIVESLRIKARIPKRWAPDEIEVWLMDCRAWFQDHKNGAPG